MSDVRGTPRVEVVREMNISLLRGESLGDYYVESRLGQSQPFVLEERQEII